MKVKICGITNYEDASLCAGLGADAIGFIFYKQSKRYIEPDQAKRIIAKLPFLLMKVGVFVNEEAATVNTIAKNIGLSAVQLHGDEDIKYINQMNVPVIKGLRIKEGFNFQKLAEFGDCTFLLDTFSQKEMGGTGTTFDWNIIPAELRDRIILAGGISADNIEKVYREISPQAVDLSSSLEEYPGKKDKDKVVQFFKILNQLRGR